MKRIQQATQKKLIRRIAVFAMLFLLVSGIVLYMGGSYIDRTLLQANENTAMDIALLVRNSFQVTDEEVAYMKRLSFNEMEVDPLNRRLMEAGSGVALNAQVNSIYLVAPLSQEEIKYIADEEMADFLGCAPDTPLDGVWLFNGRINAAGEFEVAQREDIYRYTVLSDELLTGMEQRETFGSFSADAWGEFITGYTPIYTTEGNFVGLLGVDIAPDEYRISAQSMVFILVGVFAVIAVTMAWLFCLFYFKYAQERDAEFQEREARYQRQLVSMSELEDEKLIAKGQNNLTKNGVIFFHLGKNETPTVNSGDTYDHALAHLASNVERPDERETFLHTLNRQNLMQAFAQGQTEGGLEFKRAMPDDASAWAALRYTLFEEPVSHDIIVFLYAYDVTERVIDEQIVARLSSMEYDGLGLLDVKTGQYALRNILTCIEGPPVIGSGDFETRARTRLAALVEPSEKESVLEQFRIQNIVTQLESKRVYSVTYTILGENGERSRKKFQFCYLDEERTIILYCRSDVTESYLEEQHQKDNLQRAADEAIRANEAKSEFLARMSHDMRTPMNGILGTAELSLDEADGDVLRKNMEKIKQSGEYLLSLINDILDFQKIESGKLDLDIQVVQARTLVSSIMEIIQSAAQVKNITFRLDNKNIDLDWYVRVDPVRMKQIFINLLSNAVKFTPEGGTITFEAQCLSQEQMRAHTRVRVCDTGVGMSEDFIANRLYQPFSQELNAVSRQYAGSGLGLSIVHSLVEMMGGTIAVESCLGEGTTFTVDLEIARVDAAEVEHLRSADKREQFAVGKVLDGKQVLLVEDHPLNAEIAGRLLNKAGIQVTWAEDGLKGVQTFTKSAPGTYDAVLMDIRMPVMDGLEATEMIRAMNRPDAATIPILAMSANAFPEDVQKSLDAGMNAHLPKPVDPKRLYETLAEFWQAGDAQSR